MGQALVSDVRSWTWHEHEEGWLEHCVISRHGARQVYSGLVVASDFQVVYSLVYCGEDGRQEVSCRLRRPDGSETTLTIGNVQGSGPGDWLVRRNSDDSFRPQLDLGRASDLDLSWTPLTNTFAIWRLDLAVGDSREIMVAWVQLPDLKVGAVPQRYTRLAERRYRFEGSGGFAADLDIDEFEMVERYGDIWTRRDVMAPRALLD